MVAALPPVSGEVMSVPFVAARRWLMREAEGDTSDVEGAAATEEDRDSGGASPRPAMLWYGDKSRAIAAGDLRPGQTIVVPASVRRDRCRQLGSGCGKPCSRRRRDSRLPPGAPANTAIAPRRPSLAVRRRLPRSATATACRRRGH